MSDILKLVGEKIRLIRKEKGLTQEDLAEMADLQHSYIGGVERGERNISLLTLEKITNGLDVSPSLVFNFADTNISENLLNKQGIIEAQKSLLLNRSVQEITAIQNITNEIITIIDNKQNN